MLTCIRPIGGYRQKSSYGWLKLQMWPGSVTLEMTLDRPLHHRTTVLLIAKSTIHGWPYPAKDLLQLCLVPLMLTEFCLQRKGLAAINTVFELTLWWRKGYNRGNLLLSSLRRIEHDYGNERHGDCQYDLYCEWRQCPFFGCCQIRSLSNGSGI